MAASGPPGDTDSDAGTIAEVTDADRLAAYQLVAQRQLHYNGLLWQVPVLSLTAQAFLFTIALSGSVTEAARMIAAALALVVAFASMHLMARHRQADVADSHLLEDLAPRALEGTGLHGREFKARRDAHPAGGPLARLPWAYRVWMFALAVFGAAAMGVMVVTAVDPGALAY